MEFDVSRRIRLSLECGSGVGRGVLLVSRFEGASAVLAAVVGLRIAVCTLSPRVSPVEHIRFVLLWACGHATLDLMVGASLGPHGAPAVLAAAAGVRTAVRFWTLRDSLMERGSGVFAWACYLVELCLAAALLGAQWAPERCRVPSSARAPSGAYLHGSVKLGLSGRVACSSAGAFLLRLAALGRRSFWHLGCFLAGGGLDAQLLICSARPDSQHDPVVLCFDGVRRFALLGRAWPDGQCDSCALWNAAGPWAAPDAGCAPRDLAQGPVHLADPC